MCGLVGIFDCWRTRPIDGRVLQAMNDAVQHRGPDDGRVFQERGIGLGHRRLAIIDLAAGQQPLFNEDGSVCVVYNGEIYNFREIARELTELGHVFRTHCDTEVIVHAWEAWGADCVTRFRGMFAFAVYDANHQCVFLGRDRLGIKPLYYSFLNDGRLIFGSELTPLLLCPEVAREIDPLAVEDYLAFGYIPDPRSIYKGIRKLPPAHTLLVSRGQARAEPEAYWNMAFDDQARADEISGLGELRDRLSEAVSIRLISEVPLGAFLSGGVDSSAVVAAIARAQDTPVNTCSISFGESDYDESRFAAAVARRYATNHRTRTLDPNDFGLLSELPRVYGEPFADSSALPTYRVCEEARRHVTVTLSGDGGDEAFAGYPRYRWHHGEELLRRRLPGGLRRPLFGLLGRAYPEWPRAPKALRAKATLQAIARDNAPSYFHSVSVLSDDLRESLYTPAMKRVLQGYRAVDLIRHHMASAPTEHPLSRVQYVDMKTYLPGDILTKVDRASMAHGLEVRVPFLDHKFLEWAGRIPASEKLKGREGKYVLKKAMEPWLPNDVLYRPKMGFAVPLKNWFRGPLRDVVHRKLQNGVLADTGYFQQEAIDRMLNDHMRGERDYSQAIWSLLMFSGFLEDVHGEVNETDMSAASMA